MYSQMAMGPTRIAANRHHPTGRRSLWQSSVIQEAWAIAEIVLATIWRPLTIPRSCARYPRVMKAAITATQSAMITHCNLSRRSGSDAPSETASISPYYAGDGKTIDDFRNPGTPRAG